MGYIESHASRIFTEAVNHARLPMRASGDHEWLVFYMGMQHSRTVGPAEQHNERSEKVAKAILRHKAELEGNSKLATAIDSVRIRRANPVSELIEYGAIGANLLADLTFVLIQNASNTPFIASDTPVVLHNRLYEGQQISVTGYANVGLQLFLPIGPQLAIFGFDGDAYTVQADVGGLVKVKDDEQVGLINDLQWEAAHAVLLVPPEMSTKTLQASALDWSSRRSKDRTISRDEIVYQSESKVRTRYGSGWAPSTVPLDLAFVISKLPEPAPLGPWDVPPFRDADHVARVDQELRKF